MTATDNKYNSATANTAILSACGFAKKCVAFYENEGGNEWRKRRKKEENY